ncbi:MAG: hypothetical protein JW834_04470 [Candidatus Diapherotrites archaeon]|nr:hypothetical protein [Candidatus Diapherotrites archaeon]
MLGERGQSSTELILVLAAVLAVTLILVSTLQGAAKGGGSVAEKNAEETLKTVKKMG